MYYSKLLAMDKPYALKTTFFNGAAWDLDAFPLLDAVEYLNKMEGIAQASFHGDRAHIIVRPDVWTGDRLIVELERNGITTHSIETVESSLENVFTLLAHTGGNPNK
jgi:hypothetical protein